MSSFLNNFGSARRSIRNIWLKDLYYFRSNHPIFILIFIAISTALYNIWWQNAITAFAVSKDSSQVSVFDNFRLAQHKFVKMMICIPSTVVDYRFSTVTDAIHLTHLDYPDLEFTKDLQKARDKLSSGDIQILILFTTLIETGKKIEYNIISKSGDLNKQYCVKCDQERQETWGNAIESQIIVNRFLHWVVIARRLTNAKPNFHLTNVYVKEVENDSMYSKRQSDLFLIWLLLLPICSRLINLWDDDRNSGLYKTVLSLGIRRFEYFIAKFIFWYGISLIVSCVIFAVNVSVVPEAFSATYLPFIICYVACITTFTIFLATLFPGSPFLAKFVGFLLMIVGEFGFGTEFHGIGFFQLSARYFGESAGIDAICLLCMTFNSLLMIAFSVYLDTFFYSYTQQPLSFYFPLERSYWIPGTRNPQVDKFFTQQILTVKSKKDGDKKKSNAAVSPQKEKTTSVKNTTTGPVPKVPSVPLVVLYGICKNINNQWKVNEVSLTVNLGEVVTLYGYRGCGSDEILSIIGGTMKPEYGEVMMEQSQRPLMITKTTKIPVINYLNVAQYLGLVSHLRGVSLTAQTLCDILGELDLLKVQNRTLDLLSTTQKERLRIAAVFVGQPDLVLIDWPTEESLPEWKYMIYRFIEKRKGKRSVVIVSYDAEETEAISDKVVLLSEGYVIFNGPVDIYKHSINSVFEIRLWPLTEFTNDQISGMLTTMTLGDDQMRNDAKYFETPNGKLRVTLPIIYRRSVPLILRELESVAGQYQIAFYELSKPNIHDIYANACCDSQQYKPLENYDKLKDEYAKQQTVNPTPHYLKNMSLIFKDRQLMYQAMVLFSLFLILGTLSLITYQHDTHRHTREVSLESYSNPVTIYCENCEKEQASDVSYSMKSGSEQLRDNQAVLLWRNDTAKADLELFSVSRGDEIFTMVIQNFAISQLISKITGKYPKIRPTLESDEFRTSSDKTGFSTIFRHINKNKAAMILSKSYRLMYAIGVFQTFLFTLSVLLPLRLVSVNMGPENSCFQWPRYLYFGIIFGLNLVVCLVLSIILTVLLLLFGFFATNPASCFFKLVGAWFMVYLSTLPVIYGLMFTIRNSMAIVPSVIAVSLLLVNLPTIVASYSVENQISLQSLLKILSVACMLSPPTSLQVLAAFLNVGEFHEDNQWTITSLILFCGAHFWTLIVFSIVVFQPGFSIIRQFWFSFTTAIWSSFEQGTTLKPGARLKNSFIFVTTSATNNEVVSKDSSGRTPAAGDVEDKLGANYISGESTSNDDMSYITNYEEHLIEKMASMKRWDDKQEVPVDNSATYLLGDQRRIKSALMKTISEINVKEQIAFVPFNETLPTGYTPIELLQSFAACRGVEISADHIEYLLTTFGMKKYADVPINNLIDSDRRILMFLTQLVVKPSLVILDQLEMFIPHSKMMTVWSLCSRLRSDGVGIIFNSGQSSFAEHTATNCAHMCKCQFVSTLPPTTIKSKMRCTVIEIVPKVGIETKKLFKMLQLALPEVSQMPSTSNNISLTVGRDDVEMIESILGTLRVMTNNIHRYSLRSGNFDEFVASAFGK